MPLVIDWSSLTRLCNEAATDPWQYGFTETEEKALSPMLIKTPSDIKSSEITPKRHYLNRRKFIQGSAGLALGSALPGLAHAAGEKLKNVFKGGPYNTDEPLTSFEDITSYNNFYEFGTGKTDPAENAHSLKPSPWDVVIDGEVDKPGKIALEDLIKPHQLEERIYRLRCVEAWSMVIPWIGFPLGALLSRFEPSGAAKYVAFETLLDPEQMPGQKRRVLDWPYREGLRLDEAMHPLTIMATGIYGREIPNQNGAPLRLVVPWKYGFKSIKSIVKITVQDEQPVNTWQALQPSEYGFYANVNPEVDHPRWSQATERRIGGGLFARRQETLMFNGYEAEVAELYAGMDLSVNY